MPLFYKILCLRPVPLQTSRNYCSLMSAVVMLPSLFFSSSEDNSSATSCCCSVLHSVMCYIYVFLCMRFHISSSNYSLGVAIRLKSKDTTCSNNLGRIFYCLQKYYFNESCIFLRDQSPYIILGL